MTTRDVWASVFVVTTGKGTVFIVRASSESLARDKFLIIYKGLEIASIVRAERFVE
jgi:hypothetical protein